MPDVTFCTTRDPIEELTPGGQMRAGAMSSVLWDKPKRGAVQLNVVFLDGHPTVQDLVKKHVRPWEQHANVKFNFLDVDRFIDADIRITMPRSRTFHSYLGNQALMFDRRTPSMTLGFTDDLLVDEKETRRLILHEFGHALGLIHEHQNPRGGLKFKVPEVYQYFWQTQHWDEKTVRENVIVPAKMTELKNATEFDPESIMLYSFPAWIIQSGPDTATSVNYDLSEDDKRYIASIYPKEGKTPIEDELEPVGTLPLKIGQMTTGTIPIRGAEIPYHFEVKTGGRYVIETTTPPGSREEFWVLTLYDSAGEFLVTDLKGSSPHGLNAMIERDLSKGIYIVKVRHRLRTGLGEYGLIVRKAK